jgi:hypothetical protein
MIRYLYYHLWQSFSKIKTNDTPEYNSMILISVAEVFNLELIIGILKALNVNIGIFNILQMEGLSKTEIRIFSFFIALPFFVLNYFYLVKPRLKIAMKYENETKTQRIIGTILAYVYLIGSIGITAYFGQLTTR